MADTSGIHLTYRTELFNKIRKSVSKELAGINRQDERIRALSIRKHISDNRLILFQFDFRSSQFLYGLC